MIREGETFYHLIGKEADAGARIQRRDTTTGTQ